MELQWKFHGMVLPNICLWVLLGKLMECFTGPQDTCMLTMLLLAVTQFHYLLLQIQVVMLVVLVEQLDVEVM